jgi:UDP-N-acetylmuramyl pentapeptide phosphotransferase/UDP-N-acetylglucosamine-1-phosphate transferase
MTNLYNFMDGMDGFAGGMTLLGFGAYAVLGWQAGEALFTLASLMVAASAAGFLVFNFPPAKIFMGDVGSSVLGFLSACFSLWAVAEKIDGNIGICLNDSGRVVGQYGCRFYAARAVDFDYSMVFRIPWAWLTGRRYGVRYDA